MDRSEAWRILTDWTKSESLRRHARSVEIAMRALAPRYGGDPEQWGIAGLLHDADYEAWPDEHPKRIVALLEERGERELAAAIAAHYTLWGQPYESDLARALVATDELTGFLVACCLVRPDGILSLKPKSVRKKFKDRSFAAKVDREEVLRGLEILGVDFAEHVAFLIEALKPHAAELGITGRGSP